MLPFKIAFDSDVSTRTVSGGNRCVLWLNGMRVCMWDRPIRNFPLAPEVHLIYTIDYNTNARCVDCFVKGQTVGRKRCE